MQYQSPDTIIPDLYDPRSWNRYSYVRYNPINRVDPTGHRDEGPGELSLRLPTNIDDPKLMTSWIYLYETESGRELANYILENNIAISPPTNDGTDIFGEVASREANNSISLASNDYEQSAAMLAATLGHEAFHNKFGVDNSLAPNHNSLLEEHLAFKTESQIQNELCEDRLVSSRSDYEFSTADTQNELGLRQWFSREGLSGFYISTLNLPAYPPIGGTYRPVASYGH